MRSLLVVLPLLVCTALGAQSASYTYIDQKPPYKNSSPPLLTAVTLPRLGQTFTLEVPESGLNCCPFEMYGWLATGVRRVDVRLDALGGFLFVSPDVVLPTPIGSPASLMSRIRMSFVIPSSSQLLGVQFYQQVLRTAWNPFWRQTDLSRGAVGVIGR